MMRNRAVTAFLSTQLNQIGKQSFHSASILRTAAVPSLRKSTYPSIFTANRYNLRFRNDLTKMSFSTSSTPSASEILASFGDANFEGNDIATAMHALANADAVCFDVDSTVIQEEGIDVLADSLGKGPAVADFTAKAMGGSVKFEDALAARLDIMKPSKSSILKCLESNPIPLSPGVDRFIETLHKHGIDVFLVSGGFRIMIEPVAKELMVAKTNIYANTILFDEKDGDTYKGFDATEPTSADGGKPKALNMIKEKYGYKNMIMVGDGATDAQAKPPAKAFVGFGGVVVREPVKEKACWFVKDFEDMITVVEKFAPKDKRV